MQLAKPWCLWIGALCVFTFTLTGCETEETNKIAEAQACLDKVRVAGQAAKCADKVDGLTSAFSYRIRCSAHFLDQGFMGSRFASAFEALEDNEGSDATIVFAGKMAFNSAPAAQDMFEDCNKSGSKGMKFIASASLMATTLVAAVPGNLLDLIDADGGLDDTALAQLENNIKNGNFDPTTTDDASLGQSVVAINDLYCTEDKEEEDLCQQISAAIAGNDGDLEAIGAQLRAELQN